MNPLNVIRNFPFYELAGWQAGWVLLREGEKDFWSQERRRMK
jgi:hypothetical protein